MKKTIIIVAVIAIVAVLVIWIVIANKKEDAEVGEKITWSV